MYIDQPHRKARAISKVILVAACLCAQTLGCRSSRGPEDTSPSSSTTARPIRLGAYFWPGSFWIDVANKKGWFKEAGLNVECIDTNADYFGSMGELVKGNLDFVGFTFYDFVLTNARGGGLCGILCSDVSYGADALIARPEIRTGKDLKGKKVGVPKGTYLEFMLNVIARREGLDLDNVVTVEINPEFAAKEIVSKKLAAVMTWEPFATEAVKAVGGKRLFTTAELPGISASVYALRQDFAKSRPEEVHRMVEVWERATEYIKTHREEAYEIVAEVNRKPIEVVRQLAAIDKTLDRHENQLAFSYASGFDSLHGTWRQMNDFMLDRGLIEHPLDSEKYLDASFFMSLK